MPHDGHRGRPRPPQCRGPTRGWLEAPARHELEAVASGRANPDTVAAYYDEQRPTGVGVAGGLASQRLEAMDFDEREIYHAWRERALVAGLGVLVERLEEAYLEHSPRGVHLLWRCDTIAGNTKLAQRLKTPDEQQHPQDRIKTLIETRGRGGYIIIAPSNGTVHPEGGAYTRVRGSLATIATISPEEREALLDLARTFDALPKPQPQEPRTLVSGTPDHPRPGDEFNARTSWRELLEPWGWTYVYSQGDEDFYRRPGKTIGISASVNYKGCDCLYVFSTSTPFEPERSYTRFGAWTVVEHGGDFLAAARALGAAGYGAQAADRFSTVSAGSETVGNAQQASVGAKSDAAQETVSPFQSEDDPAAEENSDDADALRDTVVRPAGTPWPRYAIGGCVYELGELRVIVQRAGTKWQVSIYRGPQVEFSDKVDLASAKHRAGFARAVPGLSQPALEALEQLLLGLALVAEQDRASWDCWRANLQEADRERAAQAREREAQAEAAAETEARAAEAQAQAALAAPLLAQDDLLYRVGQTIGRLGVVGEEANRILLYLLFTSRFMDRSISGVVKGDSAGGKNNLVERTMELIPAGAHIEMSGMSERALVYDQREYAHKTLVFFEAQGQQGEMQEYLIRSLISEGRLIYGTVEKVDGQLQTVTIEKHGPTNFITTTTQAEVHAENETRLWSLVVDDSEATTRQVHALQAQRAAGQIAVVDTAPWLAAQRWLEHQGAHAAVIPFAPALAEHMPRRPLRLRRDFDRLLGLIQIIAILHQRQRERDPERRVVATLADYAMASRLVEPAFRAAVHGVTQKTLDLVAALRDILAERGTDATASYPDLMARTGKRKAFLSRWLKPAIEAGLVVNRETENGKAARLQLGAVEMDTRPALPGIGVLAAEGQTVVWVDPLTGERKIFPEPPLPSDRNGETPPGVEDVPGTPPNTDAKNDEAGPSPDRFSGTGNGSETVAADGGHSDPVWEWHPPRVCPGCGVGRPQDDPNDWCAPAHAGPVHRAEQCTV